MRFFDNKNRSDKEMNEEEAVPGRVRQTVTVDDLAGLPRLLDESAGFWFSQSEDGKVPDWARFSPSKHVKFLPHILLCEVIDGKFFVRVAGETVLANFPAKIANQYMHETDIPELAHFPDELGLAVSAQLPLYVVRPQAWVLGDDVIGYQAIHMPFQTEGAGPDRVMSVITFNTEPEIGL